MEVTLTLYRHAGSERFVGVRARLSADDAIIYEAWDPWVGVRTEPAVTLPPMGLVDAAILARGLIHCCPNAVIEVDEFARWHEADERQAGGAASGTRPDWVEIPRNRRLSRRVGHRRPRAA